jgi:hypothetical protein
MADDTFGEWLALEIPVAYAALPVNGGEHL